MKRLLSILLILVVLISAAYNAAAEYPEFRELLDDMNRVQALYDTIRNGLELWPEHCSQDEYFLDAYPVFPDAADPDEADQYFGMPFLLTGTVLACKGYGIDFQLDDGRLCIISFNPFDFDADPAASVSFGKEPRKGKRVNIYCTFTGMSYELIDPNCLHFIASASEEARRLALQRK